MYRSFTPELFWSISSIVDFLVLELFLSSVNLLLLTGHISRNCPQKRRTMVHQMLGEMTDAERTELLQVKEEKKEEAQGFQQPQQ